MSRVVIPSTLRIPPLLLYSIPESFEHPIHLSSLSHMALPAFSLSALGGRYPVLLPPHQLGSTETVTVVCPFGRDTAGHIAHGLGLLGIVVCFSLLQC